MTTRSMTPTHLVLALVAAGVLGGAGATFVSATHARAAAPTATSLPGASMMTPMGATPTAVGAPDFSQITARNGAAVVNISVSGMKLAINDADEAPAAQRRGPQGIDPNDPFFEFFRRFQGPNGGLPGQREMPVRGQGSGFIVSADGLILTNAHVVRDAKDVTVKLTDRREFQAKVLGSDPKSDVAVLKIDAKNLPVVPMGSSGDLKVGEWVLAIGSPFGFDHSVTAGIVSAKGRSLPSDNYVPFIQTDVAINPGNSGGPLFNLDGEVIGVNSQIYSRTGGFMGLSFAIPTEVAMRVVEQLKSQGHVSRGWLGVQIQDVTRELAESFGMKKPEGALVSKILPKSPAEQAGLQIGDIITAFNGQEINASAELPPLVGMTKIGDTATVKVLRQGSPKDIQLKIGSLPEEEPAIASGKEEPTGGETLKRLGLNAINLTPEMREQLEVPKNGVLVQGVTPGPAYDAGLRRGDVILRVQDQTVKDLNHFKDLVKNLPKGKSVAMLVQRRGSSLFLALKLKD